MTIDEPLAPTAPLASAFPAMAGPPDVTGGAPPSPSGRTIRWGCGDIGFGLGLTLVLSLVISIPVVVILAMQGGGSLQTADAVDLNSPWIVGSGLLATWLGLGGWSLVASKWRGLGSLRDDFQFWWKLPRDLGLGLAGGVVAVVAGALVALAQGALEIEAVSNGEFLPAARDSNVAVFVLLGLAAAVGAPVVEELFFRGLAFTAIERRLNTTWAVILSTVVFGMLHFQVAPGWAAPFLVLHITVFGLVLGLLRAYTGRCGASVVAHMAINGFGVATVALGIA